MSEAVVTGNDSLPGMLRLGLSDAFLNKDIVPTITKRAWVNANDEHKYSTGYVWVEFDNKAISLKDLYNHATSGKAFCVASTSAAGSLAHYRHEKHFIQSQIIGLDLDNNVSVEDCIAHDFVAEYAAFVYPSPSNGKPPKDNPDGKPIAKTRVIFALDASISDPDQYRKLVLAAMHVCSDLDYDESCKDPVRFFFGSNQDGAKWLGNTLPVSVLEDIAKDIKDDAQEQPSRTDEENNRIRELNQQAIKDDKKKKRYYSYASAALDNKADDVARTTTQRHTAVYKAAIVMGSMVAANMITSSEVSGVLTSAAQKSGLKSNIQRQIDRGLEYSANSPYDLAELDRRWESKRRAFVQGRADTKREKVAEKQRLQKALDDIDLSADNPKVHQLRQDAYKAGIYESWWDSKDIPIAQLSAIMNLSNTKSLLPVVIGKMHRAFLAGRLDWSSFTIEDVCNITNKARRVVVSCLETLQSWGFIRFLRTIYIYISNTMSSESTQNSGRPPKRFTINTDVSLKLERMITIFMHQRHHKNSVPEYTRKMLEDMGVERHEDYASAMKRNDAIRKDLESRSDSAAYAKEMNGDGNNWGGWKHALGSTFSIPLDWGAIEDNKDLRYQILRHWVKDVRTENTREELTRLLGCSDATLQAAMDESDIGSTRRYGGEEISEQTLKRSGGDLRPIVRDIARVKRAHIYDVKIKSTDGKWYSYSLNEGILSYARNPENAEKIFVRYCQPSVQYIISVTSRRLKDVQFIQHALAWSLRIMWGLRHEITDFESWMGEQTSEATTEVIEEPVAEPAPKAERKPASNPVVQDDDYTKYNMTFLIRKLKVETFMFTPHRLGNDYSIMDDDNKVIYRGRGMDDIVTYLNKHASKKILRKSSDYFETNKVDINAEVTAILEERREQELQEAKTIYLNQVAQDEYMKTEFKKSPEVDKPRVVLKLDPAKHVNRFDWFIEHETLVKKTVSGKAG